MNPVFANLPTTIFEVMSRLAQEKGAINLGQGFPETDGFADVREAVARFTMEASNQYPPMRGLPELREAAAEHYARLQGIDLDWRSEITITSGATEAIAAALFALVSPGDEVAVFEPFYDAYVPLARRAGAVVRLARLEPPRWAITEEALARAFTPRTKVVIFNTPGNPTGRVYSAEELALLARFVRRADAIVVSDEVWEHITFDGARHLSLLAVPGLRDRCVKIGSAGKMFALTGWKVGFVCAPAPLTDIIAKAHQYLTFATPPNLQRAVAFGLAKPEAAFAAARGDFQRSRDRLVGALTAGGYKTLPCAGAYFVAIDLPGSGLSCDAETFSRRAIEEAGVASIPLSVCYAENPRTDLARLCFAKSDATLDAGAARLIAARDLFV